MERKKRKQRSIYKFTNVSGTYFTLEINVHEGVSRFVVKRVVEENIPGRVLCFFSLLLVYVVITHLGIIDGWYCSPVFGLGMLGLLNTTSKILEGDEESLLVVENLGLQIDIKYVVGSKSTFVPKDIVKDLFINEVISRHRVIYILSVLTKDREKIKTIIPLFQETLPRIDCLQVIYAIIKSTKCKMKLN